MKKIKIAIVAILVLQSAIVVAQKEPAKKTAVPVKTVTPPANNNKPVTVSAGANSLLYTIEEQDGKKREVTITSAPKPVTEVTNYFNTARVDLVHTDENGKKQPILKLDINNEKNQNIAGAMIIPIVNDTGTVTATYQSDYDNIIGWSMRLDGYRISPQTITITISKWAAVGDFIEGNFSGTASLLQENKMYDTDSPAPTVNITNGKFKIRRVKDQTTYGGE